jgi:hypothetical protein
LDIARRGDPQEQPTPVEGDRYTVLLLDEQQLDRLLARPHLKTIGSNAPRTLTVWSRMHYVKAIGMAAAAIVVAVMAVVWLRAATKGEPEATAAAVAPAPVVKDESPAVSTGASFSVQVASFARDAEARATANRLTKTGLFDQVAVFYDYPS